jgi:hypothetical protein
MWVIKDTLLLSQWSSCPQRSWKCLQTGLSNFQRNRLFQLANLLDTSSAEGLAFAIRKYLKTDFIFKNLTVAKKHMDLMARSMVEAMEAGTPLQIAGVDGSSEVCGTFVGKCNQNIKIFDSLARWRRFRRQMAP